MNKHDSLFFDIYYQGLNLNRLKLYNHAKGEDNPAQSLPSVKSLICRQHQHDTKDGLNATTLRA